MRKDFSIIIATYNAIETLSDCIDSIRLQESAQYEVLIVDGESTDGTQQILRENQELFSYLIIEPDNGIYDAWNKAIEHCNGEWVIFLGADDRIKDPKVLGNLARLISKKATSKTKYIYGQIDLLDGDTVIDRFGEELFPNLKKRVIMQRGFSHTGLLHHHSLFTEYGKFDATYKIAGDSEFLTRTLKDPDIEVMKVDLDVAVMGQGGISTSVESRFVAYLEDMRALRRHGYMIPPRHILTKAFRATTAYCINRTLGPKFTLGICNLYRRLVGKNTRNKV